MRTTPRREKEILLNQGKPTAPCSGARILPFPRPHPIMSPWTRNDAFALACCAIAPRPRAAARPGPCREAAKLDAVPFFFFGLAWRSFPRPPAQETSQDDRLMHTPSCDVSFHRTWETQTDTQLRCRACMHALTHAHTHRCSRKLSMPVALARLPPCNHHRVSITMFARH